MIDSDRAVLVACVVVVLVCLTALGLWLVVHGVRGSLTVCRPRCRRCRHLLGVTGDGAPARGVCPECGAGLSRPGSVVHASRMRRPRLALGGVLLLLVTGASAGLGRGAAVPTPGRIAPAPMPQRVRPPEAAPVPWPTALGPEELRQYGRVLSQAPDAVLLASARAGLASDGGWITEIVARVNDGTLTQAVLVPVLRAAVEQARRITSPYDRWPYRSWAWTRLVMPTWLREELIWASLGPPRIRVAEVGDGSVPILVFRRRPIGPSEWTESPLVVHSVRLVGDGLDLALDPTPGMGHHFALGPMIPRGTYEVLVDLERRATTPNGTPGTISRRTTVSRCFELVRPGDPLATMAPDPAFVAAVREAYREVFVAHRHRDGRPDFVQVLAIDRSFGGAVPVHPAIFRVDVVVGDVRVATDLLVFGVHVPTSDRRLRGELDPGQLPDPLPETVTIELRPAPEYIDDVGLRTPVIIGDTIRFEDVPLFVNPGPRWLPD